MKQIYKILLFALFLNANVGALKSMEGQTAPNYSTWSDEAIEQRLSEIDEQRKRNNNDELFNKEFKELEDEKYARTQVSDLETGAIRKKIDVFHETFPDLSSVSIEHLKQLNRWNNELKKRQEKPLPIDKKRQAQFIEGRLPVAKRIIGQKERRRPTRRRKVESVIPQERVPLFENVIEASEFTEGEPKLSSELVKYQASRLRKTSGPKPYVPQAEEPALPQIPTGGRAALRKTVQPAKSQVETSEASSELQAKLARVKKAVEKKQVRKEPAAAKEAFFQKEKETISSEVAPIAQEPIISAEPEKTSEKRKSAGFWGWFGLGEKSESDEEKVESAAKPSQTISKTRLPSGSKRWSLPAPQTKEQLSETLKAFEKRPFEAEALNLPPAPEEGFEIGSEVELPTFAPGEEAPVALPTIKVEEPLGEGFVVRAQKRLTRRKKIKTDESDLKNALVALHRSLNQLSNTLLRGHAV